MSVHSVSAGEGLDYYADPAVRAGEVEWSAGAESDAYALGAAEAPGVWVGDRERLAAYGIDPGQSLPVDGGEAKAVLEQVLTGRHAVTGEMVPGRYTSAPDGPTLRAPRRPRGVFEVKSTRRDGSVATAQRTGKIATDLTFSAPKSVSVVFALVDQDAQEQISVSLAAAEEAALAYLAREGMWSRAGNGGREQVEVDVPVAVRFVHRSNREGAPQVHSHVLIPNVGECPDGKWRAVDGTQLRAYSRAAGAIYHATLRQEMTRRLGVAWEFRNGPAAGVTAEAGEQNDLQVREALRREMTFAGWSPEEIEKVPNARWHAEIAGVPKDLIAKWSGRAGVIDEVFQVELARAAAVRAERGRPALNAEEIARLRQNVVLRTRPDKVKDEETAQARVAADLSEAMSTRGRVPAQRTREVLEADFADAQVTTQRAWWEAQAARLGHTRDSVMRDVAEAARVHSRGPVVERAAIGAAALHAAQVEHSTFSRRHLEREIAARVPLDLDPRLDVAQYVSEIADEVLSGEQVVQVAWAPHEIDRLADRAQAQGAAAGKVVDGVERPVVDERVVTNRAALSWYVTKDALTVEREIIDRAVLAKGQGRGLVAQDVLDEHLNSAAAAGVRLSSDQQAVVETLASSGDGIEVVEAPAGSGKTTMLRPVIAAWRQAGFDVVALAPTSAAAKVMAEETGAKAVTVDKVLTQWDRGQIAVHDRTVIVVDEAGMVGRDKINRLTAVSEAVQAKIVLVGDSHQLSPVKSAGGTFYDLGEAVGRSELTRVHRFHESWEADASLGLRVGNDAALDAYIENDRIGYAETRDDALDSVYQRWDAATQRGANALMLAATREDVDALNERAREDLSARGLIGGRKIRLRGKTLGTLNGDRVTVAGREFQAGYVIVARKNDARIRVGGPSDAQISGMELRLARMNRQIERLAAKQERGWARLSKATGKDRARRQALLYVRAARLRRAVSARNDLRQSLANARVAAQSAGTLRNGMRFEVLSVDQAGALRCAEILSGGGLGAEVTLPRHYVAEHVDYGWASTVHSAQGMTADVAFTVADESMTRELLYVAMTRGKAANHLVVSPSRESVEARKATEKRAAVEQARETFERTKEKAQAVLASLQPTPDAVEPDVVPADVEVEFLDEHLAVVDAVEPVEVVDEVEPPVEVPWTVYDEFEVSEEDLADNAAHVGPLDIDAEYESLAAYSPFDQPEPTTFEEALARRGEAHSVWALQKAEQVKIEQAAEAAERVAKGQAVHAREVVTGILGRSRRDQTAATRMRGMADRAETLASLRERAARLDVAVDARSPRVDSTALRDALQYANSKAREIASMRQMGSNTAREEVEYETRAARVHEVAAEVTQALPSTEAREQMRAELAEALRSRLVVNPAAVEEAVEQAREPHVRAHVADLDDRATQRETALGEAVTVEPSVEVVDLVGERPDPKDEAAFKAWRAAAKAAAVHEDTFGEFPTTEPTPQGMDRVDGLDGVQVDREPVGEVLDQMAATSRKAFRQARRALDTLLGRSTGQSHDEGLGY